MSHFGLSVFSPISSAVEIWLLKLPLLRANLTKWPNTLEQFVGCLRRIV